MKKKIVIFMCLVITNLCFAGWNEVGSIDRLKEVRYQIGRMWKGVYVKGIREIHIFKSPQESLEIDVHDAMLTDTVGGHVTIGVAVKDPVQSSVSIVPRISGETNYRSINGMNISTKSGWYGQLAYPINFKFCLKPSSIKEYGFATHLIIDDVYSIDAGTYIQGKLIIIPPLVISAPDLELGKMRGNESRKPNTPIKSFDLKVKGNGNSGNSRIEINWDSQVEIENEKGDELPIGIQISRGGKTGDGRLSYNLDSQGKGDAKIIVNTGKGWPSKLRSGKYSGQVKIRVGYK